MPGWIGPWELAILLVVVLLVFGPKRLPEMGKSLGKGMREFKDSISGKEKEESHELSVTSQAHQHVQHTETRNQCCPLPLTQPESAHLRLAMLPLRLLQQLLLMRVLVQQRR